MEIEDGKDERKGFESCLQNQSDCRILNEQARKQRGREPSSGLLVMSTQVGGEKTKSKNKRGKARQAGGIRAGTAKTV